MAHACAFALMNTLGLVCDPVGGLVEVPCVYRNVGGVSQAVSAAQLALSGVACPIPLDEMILTMRDVGGVSYTHLDVYKRQSWKSTWRIWIPI